MFFYYFYSFNIQFCEFFIFLFLIILTALFILYDFFIIWINRNIVECKFRREAFHLFGAVWF